MSVLEREFFNLTVFKQPLVEFIDAFELRVKARLKAVPTPFVLPKQPYNSTDGQPPLLLWSPRSQPDLTAFMPHVQAGDYFVTAQASWKLKSTYVSVRSTTQNEEWPINEFDCYERGEQRRFVRAFRDSPRWDFHEIGEPLEFENVEKYQRRRIRDRFCREDLIAYLEAWGAALNDADFWQTDAQAFTFVSTMPN